MNRENFIDISPLLKGFLRSSNASEDENLLNWREVK
jgi:hypothetical protein